MGPLDLNCPQCGARPAELCWDPARGWLDAPHLVRTGLATLADSTRSLVTGTILAQVLAGPDSTLADKAAFVVAPLIVTSAAKSGAATGAAEARRRASAPSPGEGVA